MLASVRDYYCSATLMSTWNAFSFQTRQAPCTPYKFPSHSWNWRDSGSKIATILVLTNEVVNLRGSVRPASGIERAFLFPFVSTVWRARRQSHTEFSSCSFFCAHLGTCSQKQSSEFSYHQHGKFHLIPRGNTTSESEVDRIRYCFWWLSDWCRELK